MTYKIVKGQDKFYLVQVTNGRTTVVHHLSETILEIDNGHDYDNVTIKIGNVTYLLNKIEENLYEVIELEHDFFPIQINEKVLVGGLAGMILGGPMGGLMGSLVFSNL